MERSSGLMLALVLGVILGALALSQGLDRDASRTAAVGAAILEEEAILFEAYSDPRDRAAYGFDYATLCLETKVQLEWKRLDDSWPKDILHPVPAIGCRSETIEGDFGMFTAVTHWFDARGERAAFLRVRNARCDSSKSCVVDIDSFGGGQRYIVNEIDGTWTVAERQTRWIV